MFHEHFRMFARYNRWANERLLGAVAGLDDTAYRAQRGAFFGSIHGTLNHLIVADRIWLTRITGTGEAPTRLDAILFDSFDELCRARNEEDARILAAVEGLQASDFTRTLHYRNTKGDAQRKPLRQVWAHVFNHQTHHRGQVHDLLSQAGVAPPPIDLIYFLD